MTRTKLVALRNAVDLLALAMRAGYTIGPAQSFKVGAALGVGRKICHQFSEVHIHVFHNSPQEKKKHPKDMTTEEAMRHLFTPKGHKLIKKHLEKVEK